MKYLTVDEFVKDVILTGKSAATLRDYMKETGYYNLLEDGLIKSTRWINNNGRSSTCCNN